MRPMPVLAALLVLCLPSAPACIKVISPNLPSASHQLVIIGQVNNTTGPYTVSVTRTVDIANATNDFPPVSGARVVITDSIASLADTLSETSPGMYTTHTLQGIPGHRYGLTVLTGGVTYTAFSVMPQPVSLDSAQLIERPADPPNVMLYFQDPATGSSHFYQFTEALNNSPIDAVFVFSDRLSHGRYISEELINHRLSSMPGDVFTVSMYCVDSSVYTYLNTLSGASGDGAVGAPANPITNLSGGALGYFSAQTVTTRTLY